MTKRFEGKVVLVTGASSGIGRTTAVAFGREGAKVVVSGGRQESLAQTVALIRAEGAESVAVAGDCSKASDVRRMVDAAVGTYGRLDCACNTAGIEGGKPFVPTADYSEEIWDEVIAINLTGVFLCLKYEIQQMLAQGSGGAIVNMSSVAGLIGTRVGIGYGASKHGVIGATRAAGFSAERRSGGVEPITYDYDSVTRAMPWKLLPGRYTRAGDVQELLGTTDDMFVVSRPGDDIALAFEAGGSSTGEAERRTFLLFAHGYSKEMDLNSASPDETAPLPFRGMTTYPYRAPEAYPSTPAHVEYLEKYNTRIVSRPLPAIAAAVAPALKGRPTFDTPVRRP